MCSHGERKHLSAETSLYVARDRVCSHGERKHLSAETSLYVARDRVCSHGERKHLSAETSLYVQGTECAAMENENTCQLRPASKSPISQCWFALCNVSYSVYSLINQKYNTYENCCKFADKVNIAHYFSSFGGVGGGVVVGWGGGGCCKDDAHQNIRHNCSLYYCGQLCMSQT